MALPTSQFLQKVKSQPLAPKRKGGGQGFRLPTANWGSPQESGMPEAVANLTGKLGEAYFKSQARQKEIGQVLLSGEIKEKILPQLADFFSKRIDGDKSILNTAQGFREDFAGGENGEPLIDEWQRKIYDEYDITDPLMKARIDNWLVPVMLQARGSGVATLEKRHLQLVEKKYDLEQANYVESEAVNLLRGQEEFMHETSFSSTENLPEILTVPKGSTAKEMIAQLEKKGINITIEDLEEKLGVASGTLLAQRTAHGEKKEGSGASKPLYLLIKNNKVLKGDTKEVLDAEVAKAEKRQEESIFRDFETEKEKARTVVKKFHFLYTSKEEQDAEVKRIHQAVIYRYYALAAMAHSDRISAESDQILKFWTKNKLDADKASYILGLAASLSNARNRKSAERQFAALSLVLSSGNKEKIILEQSKIKALFAAIARGDSQDQIRTNNPDYYAINPKTLFSFYESLEGRRKLIERGGLKMPSIKLRNAAMQNNLKSLTRTDATFFSPYEDKTVDQVMEEYNMSRIEAESMVTQDFLLQQFSEGMKPFLASGTSSLSADEKGRILEEFESLNPTLYADNATLPEGLISRGVAHESWIKGSKLSQDYYDSMMAEVVPFISEYTKDPYVANSGGFEFATTTQSVSERAAVFSGQKPLAGGTQWQTLSRHTGIPVKVLTTTDGVTELWDKITQGENIRFMPNYVRDHFRGRITGATTAGDLLNVYKDLETFTKSNYPVISQTGGQAYVPLIAREIFHEQGGSFSSDQTKDAQYLLAFWAYKKGGANGGKELEKYYRAISEPSGTDFTQTAEERELKTKLYNYLHKEVQRFIPNEERTIKRALARTFTRLAFNDPTVKQLLDLGDAKEWASEQLFSSWLGVRPKSEEWASGSLPGLLLHWNDFRYKGISKEETVEKINKTLGNLLLELRNPDSRNIAARYVYEALGDASPEVLLMLEQGRGKNFVITVRKSMREDGGLDLVRYNPLDPDQKLVPVAGSKGPISIPKKVWTMPLVYAGAQQFILDKMRSSKEGDEQTSKLGKQGSFVELSKELEEIQRRFPEDIRGAMAAKALEKIPEWKDANSADGNSDLYTVIPPPPPRGKGFTSPPMISNRSHQTYLQMQEWVLREGDLIDGEDHFEIWDFFDRYIENLFSPTESYKKEK